MLLLFFQLILIVPGGMILAGGERAIRSPALLALFIPLAIVFWAFTTALAAWKLLHPTYLSLDRGLLQWRPWFRARTVTLPRGTGLSFADGLISIDSPSETAALPREIRVPRAIHHEHGTGAAWVVD